MGRWGEEMRSLSLLSPQEVENAHLLASILAHLLQSPFPSYPQTFGQLVLSSHPRMEEKAFIPQ